MSDQCWRVTGGLCAADIPCRSCLAVEVEARGALTDQLLKDLVDMAARAERAEANVQRVREVIERHERIYASGDEGIPVQVLLVALDGGDE